MTEGWGKDIREWMRFRKWVGSSFFLSPVVDDNLFWTNEFYFYICFSFFLVIRTQISEYMVQTEEYLTLI